jgi:hypothetical protein
MVSLLVCVLSFDSFVFILASSVFKMEMGFMEELRKCVGE